MFVLKTYWLCRKPFPGLKNIDWFFWWNDEEYLSKSSNQFSKGVPNRQPEKGKINLVSVDLKMKNGMKKYEVMIENWKLKLKLILKWIRLKLKAQKLSSSTYFIKGGRPLRPILHLQVTKRCVSMWMKHQKHTDLVRFPAILYSSNTRGAPGFSSLSGNPGLGHTTLTKKKHNLLQRKDDIWAQWLQWSGPLDLQWQKSSSIVLGYIHIIACTRSMKCFTVQQHWIIFQGTCDEFLPKSIHCRPIEQKSSQALQRQARHRWQICMGTFSASPIGIRLEICHVWRGIKKTASNCWFNPSPLLEPAVDSKEVLASEKMMTIMQGNRFKGSPKDDLNESAFHKHLLNLIGIIFRIAPKIHWYHTPLSLGILKKNWTSQSSHPRIISNLHLQMVKLRGPKCRGSRGDEIQLGSYRNKRLAPHLF